MLEALVQMQELRTKAPCSSLVRGLKRKLEALVQMQE